MSIDCCDAADITHFQKKKKTNSNCCIDLCIFQLPFCRMHFPKIKQFLNTRSAPRQKKKTTKLNIQKTKIMASGLITSWQIDGKTMETVTYYFLGSKITVNGDYSHEIKRRLLPGRKAMTNLDNILKSRDITLLTQVRLVKVIVFPVVRYGCESWTIKKAKSQRIDAFQLWC